MIMAGVFSDVLRPELKKSSPRDWGYRLRIEPNSAIRYAMMNLAAIGKAAFDAFGNPDEQSDIETHTQIIPRKLGIQLIKAEGVKVLFLNLKFTY